MAKIRTSYITGQNLYAIVWDYENNKIYYPTGEAYETYGTSGHTAADYAIDFTEIAIGYYAAEWPEDMPVGTYDVITKLRSGASPADSDVSIGGPIQRTWNGASLLEEEEETNAVDICNMALAKIGGAKNAVMITTLDPTGLTGDTKSTVEACELLYTPCRQEVLKRMKPQEFLYYADLGEESSYSGEKAEWEYVFDLPDDNLLFLKQIDESDHTIEYLCEIKQGLIFTNDLTNEDGDSAYIEYLKNETDASLFSIELCVAIATKLAAELCPRIIGGEWAWRRRQELLKEFEGLVLPTAKGINVSQQKSIDNLDTNKHSWLGDRS